MLVSVLGINQSKVFDASAVDYEERKIYVCTLDDLAVLQYISKIVLDSNNRNVKVGEDCLPYVKLDVLMIEKDLPILDIHEQDELDDIIGKLQFLELIKSYDNWDNYNYYRITQEGLDLLS